MFKVSGKKNWVRTPTGCAVLGLHCTLKRFYLAYVDSPSQCGYLKYLGMYVY
jgi:hypothetical protein